MQSARSLSFIALLAAVIAAVTTFGAEAWLWSIAGNRGLQAIGQWLTLPAQVFTFLGDEQFYLLMIPAIYWCIHKGLGADLGVLVVLSPAVNGLRGCIRHATRIITTAASPAAAARYTP